MTKIDLKEIFRSAWGYEPPARFTVAEPYSNNLRSENGQQYYATDKLGRELFLPVKLNDFILPFAVMSVSMKKTIVETPMPERGGSVNELITLDDYIFSIKGIVVSKDNSFPAKQLEELHNVFKVNASLEIRSVISDIILNGKFEHKVIVKSMNWVANAATENAKPFEMELKSDMINTLEIE